MNCNSVSKGKIYCGRRIKLSYHEFEFEKDEFEKSLEQLNSLILLYFGKTKYENDWPSKKHSHDYLEIFIVLNGSGSLLVEQSEYKLSKNDIVFINSGLEHTEISNGPEGLEYLFFAVDNIKFLNYPANRILPPELCPVYSYDTNVMKNPISEIIRLSESGSSVAPVIIKNYLIISLILFLQSGYDFDTPQPLRRNGNLQYISAKNYIDKNFTQKITLDDLAQQCYVSKWHLTRLFKQHTGYSPFEYINTKRLEFAKKLLRETDYSVTEISYKAGFNSSSYFSQIFKKTFDTSPESYRKIKSQVIKPTPPRKSIDSQ